MSLYTKQELAAQKLLRENPTIVARVSVSMVRLVLRRRAYDLRSGEARYTIRAPFVRFDRNGLTAYQI